jgi:hypothetical protein
MSKKLRTRQRYAKHFKNQTKLDAYFLRITKPTASDANEISCSTPTVLQSPSPIPSDNGETSQLLSRRFNKPLMKLTAAVLTRRSSLRILIVLDHHRTPLPLSRIHQMMVLINFVSRALAASKPASPLPSSGLCILARHSLAVFGRSHDTIKCLSSYRSRSGAEGQTHTHSCMTSP